MLGVFAGTFALVGLNAMFDPSRLRPLAVPLAVIAALSVLFLVGVAYALGCSLGFALGGLALLLVRLVGGFGFGLHGRQFGPHLVTFGGRGLVGFLLLGQLGAKLLGLSFAHLRGRIFWFLPRGPLAR